MKKKLLKETSFIFTEYLYPIVFSIQQHHVFNNPIILDKLLKFWNKLSNIEIYNNKFQHLQNDYS